MPIRDELGKYHLLAQIGSGGMGTVYQAVHTELDKVVAIKMLTRAHAENPSYVTRFRREIKTAGRLNHRNVAVGWDAGEHQGTLFLAMEYVDGVSFVEIVERRGPLAVADACELIRQAALGLQSAHDLGIIHRDVKPSNLMLSRDCLVKVLDLGLAHWNFDESDPKLTEDRHLLGTPDFMAPEQGLDPRSATIASDIYSLGCTFWYLLTGTPPFAHSDSDTPQKKLLAHAADAVQPLRQIRSDVPRGLVQFIGRMLAKNWADRPSSANEVATVMEQHASCSVLARVFDGVGPVPTQARKALGADGPIDTLPSDQRPFSKRQSPGTLAAGQSQSLGTLPSRRQVRTQFRLVGIAVSVLALMFILGLFVIELQTSEGRIKIVIDGSNPGLRVEVIQKQEVVKGWRITSQGRSAELAAGEYRVRVTPAENWIVTPEQIEISDGKAAVVRITRVVKTANPQLSVARWILDIGGRGVVSDGKASFRLARNTISGTTLIAIDLRGLGTITDDDLKRLAELNSVNELLLDQNPIHGAGLVHLSRVNGRISLNKTPITDETICFLDNRRIHTLEVGETEIGDKGITHLVNSINPSALTGLSLSATRVSVEGVKELLALARLSSLNLSNTQIANAALAIIAELPNLKRLDLAKCLRVTENGLERLQGTRLEYIRAVNMGLSDAGVERLCRINSLSELYLRGNRRVTNKCLRAISSLSGLKRLDIAYTGISEEGLRDLLPLKNLDFLAAVAGNDVTDRDAVELMFPWCRIE